MKIHLEVHPLNVKSQIMEKFPYVVGGGAAHILGALHGYPRTWRGYMRLLIETGCSIAGGGDARVRREDLMHGKCFLTFRFQTKMWRVENSDMEK